MAKNIFHGFYLSLYPLYQKFTNPDALIAIGLLMFTWKYTERTAF